jgi:hypothetical protein
MCGTSQRQYGLGQKQGKTLVISRLPDKTAKWRHRALRGVQRAGRETTEDQGVTPGELPGSSGGTEGSELADDADTRAGYAVRSSGGSS